MILSQPLAFLCALVACAITGAGVARIILHRGRAATRRTALLEGARVLRRRARTKEHSNLSMAIEDEACAQVLERLATTAPDTGPTPTRDEMAVIAEKLRGGLGGS